MTLPSLPPGVELRDIALLIAVCVALLSLFGWWRSLSRGKRRNRKRQRIARQAEIDAEKLLARYGFEVIDRQVTGWWSMWVDGVEHRVSCRVDLIVRPRNEPHAKLVAEVKTGERAPDPTFPSTRRQLLEYARVFDVEGILLLDMSRRTLHRVEF